MKGALQDAVGRLVKVKLFSLRCFCVLFTFCLLALVGSTNMISKEKLCTFLAQRSSQCYASVIYVAQCFAGVLGCLVR